MKAMQASFASGEISPLLHARVDLSRYQTGLAELKNMIVLPQGGVTRRPGIQKVGLAYEIRDKLIPFEFNSTDSAILDFGDKYLRVWYNLEGSPQVVGIDTPYAIEDVKDLRYVQSGNVVFLAHRKYKPRMLRRVALTIWELEEFDFQGGPFISSTEWGSSEKLWLYPGSGRKRHISGDIFSDANENLIGTLVKLEYTVEGRSATIESKTNGTTSPNYEVKGTFNVVTRGNWKGTIEIKRNSSGSSGGWATIRQYKRRDTDKQGQWDFSISETEDNILYRVVATHDEDSSEPATVDISASGFLKKQIYKVTKVHVQTPIVPEEIHVEPWCSEIEAQTHTGFFITDSFSGNVDLWSIGAWGGIQGYPGTVTMYQDRLVFAATTSQPQTIWMSRTGDYADFSISDPLQDDDAVTITLAGSSADGIHSLLTSTDLLAFTNSGEWKIKGAGDAGAITPSALTAHQQTNTGSKNIQPLLVNGHVIMIQSLGQKVFSLGYDLNIDGYSASEISIMSSHLFEGCEIIGMAYQKIPDSLLWFVLDDGTFVSCTYNPEHEIIGWSKHESYYGIKDIVALTGSVQTNIYMVTKNDSGTPLLVKLRKRSEENFVDIDQGFVSIARTLRLNYSGEDSSTFNTKNLISRVNISALQSKEAWVAPGNIIDDTDNWERRRRITWNYSKYVSDSDIQLDNGFSDYACVQVRTDGLIPLTIVAITPQLTTGG